jgi:hypothetical protein
MEERDFFEEICLISLYASKAVMFTAVVDSKGKLILCKFKRSNTRRQLGMSPYSCRTVDSSEKEQIQQQFLGHSCHSFYQSQLAPILKDLTSGRYNEQWPDKAHFEIADIDRNIGAKLAVTPLTENRDRYLCIYFQLPPEMPTDQHQQIISKIRNAIQ